MKQQAFLICREKGNEEAVTSHLQKQRRQAVGGATELIMASHPREAKPRAGGSPLLLTIRAQGVLELWRKGGIA